MIGPYRTPTMRALRFTRVLAVLLWGSGITTAADHTLSPGKPAEVGMNAELLQQGVELYCEAIARDEIRGAVLLVARSGRIILHEALGWRDYETKDPMCHDTMFRMASNTKPVVAAGIARLAEQGRLRFGDLVSRHLSSFRHGNAREITLHHLLTHTSGLRIKPIFYRPLIARSKEHPDAPNLRLEVDRFGRTGPTAPVGKSYSYSNAGYNTLGAVAETISGKPLERFLREAIYQPLGMKDSYHHEVAEKLDGKLDRMATVYYRRDGKWTVGWRPGQAPKYPFVRASGGMISTAQDYAIFCQMFLNGGIYNGQRVLSEESVRELIAPHTKSLYSKEELGRQTAFYGYGWRVYSDGVFAHSGSDGTSAWVDPDQQLIVLAFTQSPNGSQLRDNFFRIVRQATTQFPPVDQLPMKAGLPDPFLRPDGKRVTTPAEWKPQREWLKQLLAHYMYGRMPPRPPRQRVSIERVETLEVFAGALEERYRLTLERRGRTADLRFALIRPTEKKRYPTIIKNCRALFDTVSAGRRYEPTVERDLAAAREAVKRGYVLCKFRREDFAADEKDNRDRGVFPLYPEYDWGSIAVWAWTHQVMLDALDRLGHADLDRIVATGHSRGGQTAIAAGIFDERIDVVVPCTGGYGACATLRIRDPKGVRGTIDYLAHLKKHVPHWFGPRYYQFVGQQNRLPFDSHTLIGLIAPRPLLNTNATEDEYNNTLAVEAGMRAGRVVYDWLDRDGWARLHWRPGRHAQQEEDWTALLDFADEAFFGKRGTSRFGRWQFPDYRPPLSWSAP